MNSVDGMTVGQAAERLNMQVTSVRQLVERGRLLEMGRAGKTILIDPASVERMALTEPAHRRGRTWTERTAWAAISLLSGQKPESISSSEASRLKRRLKDASAEEVHFLARDRAQVRRLRASTDAIPVLQKHLLATGGSAMRDQVVADRFGLAGGSGTFEGYAMSGDADQLASMLGMREDLGGNVTVREVQSNDAFHDDAVPVAAIALDLMDSLATRERSAGRRVLEELLRG